MPDLNHRFQAGKMNKDLDERLVPNGEYRDAMNAQVSTSDESDMGSLQNLMGNLDISSEFFGGVNLESYGFHCVGSIKNGEKDRLYWLVSGIGLDFIAEYDYNTKKVSPIAVDIFFPNLLPGEGGRVLNFDKSYLITGINIIEDTLFWTDDNTEPKRINISKTRLGTPDFFTHTIFYVPNPDKTLAASFPYVEALDNLGNPINLKHEHITVIRKGPQTAPMLEMKNTERGDVLGSGPMVGQVTTTLNTDISLWFDPASGNYLTSNISVQFDDYPDFYIGDKLKIESVAPATGILKKTSIIVQIVGLQSSLTGTNMIASIKILSYDQNVDLTDNFFNVSLVQPEALYEFRFPRFASRYKYKDGEYSAFSPFTEIAFLPGDYDYLPKEGYNLAMVNTVRELGVCNFVDERSIPDDVVSIDILYKESDNPSVYSIKTVDRVSLDTSPNAFYENYNAISPNQLRDDTLVFPARTYGYLKIEAEMIHALLPSNQLLRPFDNVPRKALAQEVIGSRLVYANYLQNYNLVSSTLQQPTGLYTPGTNQLSALRASENITVDLRLTTRHLSVGALDPEQLNPATAYNYNSAKTIKSLRTYQLGVIYIDEYGRETPVFSDSSTEENSIYIEKKHAPRQTKLDAQIWSAKPDFAKAFKFLVKETSSEYYNLAMDRWYLAEDGNIWITFPSSDRSKVDIETFLILKKSHESNVPITDLARYKILAIENEAPEFVKTERTAVRTVIDGTSSGTSAGPILMSGGPTDVDFPYPGGTFVEINDDQFGVQAKIWDEEPEITDKQFRIVSNNGASDWYTVKSWENRNAGATIPVGGYWKITADREFGVDMGITTPFSAPASTITPAYGNNRVEFIKREQKIKPEYEGRFFVKILKDSMLQQYILGYTGLASTYTSVSQIVSQYINPRDVNTVNGGIYDPATDPSAWYGLSPGATHPAGINEILIDSDNQQTGVSACNNGLGHVYWERAGNTSNPASDSSGWFIDKIEAFRPFYYNNYYFDESNYPAFYANTGTAPLAGPSGPSGTGAYNKYQANYHASRSNHQWKYSTHGATYQPGWMSFGSVAAIGSNSGATSVLISSYWNKGWNRDPASGPNRFHAVWGGDWRNYHGNPNHQLQLIGDGTNHVSNGEGGPNGGYLGLANVKSPLLSNHPYWVNSGGNLDTVLFNETKTNGGEILPGFGAPSSSPSYGSNHSIITLSFAGMGGANSYSPVKFTMSDVSSQDKLYSYFNSATWAGDYISQQEFIDYITTPNTIWRWKEDPGQVVYVTKALSSSPAAASLNISGGTFNANEYDQSEWQPTAERGIELYNYTKIADYVTEHVLNQIGKGGVPPISLPTPESYHRRANWASQGIGNYQDSNTNFTGSGGSTTYATEASWFKRESTTSNRWPMFTNAWGSASNRRRRFQIYAEVLPGQTNGVGGTTTGTEGIAGIGPHFYSPTNDASLAPHYDHNGDVLTTPPSTVAPGIRPDGMYSGRSMGANYFTLTNDAGGTNTYDKIPGLKMQDGAGVMSPAPGSCTWQILEPYGTDGGTTEGYFSQNPGIWETEPKDDLGLEIYHEVGQIYPTELNESNIDQFFGPIHAGDIAVSPAFLSKNSKVECMDTTALGGGATIVLDTVGGVAVSVSTDQSKDIRVHQAYVLQDRVYLVLCDINGVPLNGQPGQTMPPVGSRLTFVRADGSSTSINVRVAPIWSGTSLVLPIFEVELDAHNYPVTLPFFNAYSFGNGVESNRIRDDFNQITIDKGPKVSAVLEEPYMEEQRSNGFIYSGIYNSLSGVNNLNQFIQAEKITKDLNPDHGSIQKLFARDTDLVTFCEDKVFRVLADKDALFNADGNSNVTATDRVLGQTMPFAGEYGISKNPESLASDAYRLYFTDSVRGSVLRLSRDGITPISQYGMSDWFNDNLPSTTNIIGSFDDKKKEYNISLDYYDYTTYSAKILGIPILPLAGAGVTGPITYSPINQLIAPYELYNKVEVGDDIVGPGIPIGTIVILKENLGGGTFKIHLSLTPSNNDVGSLSGPNNYGPQTVGVISDVVWDTRVYTSVETKDPITLSYADKVRGWPSFKSFHYENGISLNNEYFTFKNGQLYQHHLTEQYNNFYGEFTESSVEFLFNEIPGSVKSFQTLDYEGTQSRITSDGGLNQTSNSGEYWDNYDKLGWYVDNMYTNLQEVEPTEFKNKEGKWFSTVQGVHTEWLDDGTAGNIDTKEFSYQGIDESSAVTVIGGDFTSWDCQPISQPPPVRCVQCPVSPQSQQYDVYDGCTEDTLQAGAIASNIVASIHENDLRWFFDDSTRHNFNFDEYHFVSSIDNNPYRIGLIINPITGIIYKNVQEVLDYWNDRSVQQNWGVTFTNGIDFDTFLSLIYSVNSGNGATPDGYVNGLPAITDSAFNTANPQHSGPFLNSIRTLFGGGKRKLGIPCQEFTVAVNSLIASAPPPTHTCVEIQGLSGAYATEAMCNADTNNLCTPDPCTLIKNGPPYVINVHTNNAQPNACNDGSVNVSVFLQLPATSWQVHYEDTSGTIVATDGGTYTTNGNSVLQTNFAQGDYVAVITDDMGCRFEEPFSIQCGALPCNSQPGVFQFSKQDPKWFELLGRCWEPGDFGPQQNGGKVAIGCVSLNFPATTWGYRIWKPGIFGNTNPSNLIASNQGISPGINEVTDSLSEGNYKYQLTDDTGCVYPKVPFTLDCTDTCTSEVTIPNTSPLAWNPGQNITAANSTDGCNTDDAGGAHEILHVNFNTSTITSFEVRYYEWNTSTLGSSFPGIGNATLIIGSAQGPFTNVSNANGSIGSITGLSSTLVSGNKYAVVIFDNFGCITVEEFEIPCNNTSTCPIGAGQPAMNFAITHATSADCTTGDNGDGTIVFTGGNQNQVIANVNLTNFQIPPSWTLEFFWHDNTTGTDQMLYTYNSTNPTLPSSLAGPTNLWSSQNPQYNGYYYFTVTDMLGCVLTQNVTVPCNIPCPPCPPSGTPHPYLNYNQGEFPSWTCDDCHGPKIGTSLVPFKPIGFTTGQPGGHASLHTTSATPINGTGGCADGSNFDGAFNPFCDDSPLAPTSYFPAGFVMIPVGACPYPDSFTIQYYKWDRDVHGNFFPGASVAIPIGVQYGPFLTSSSITSGMGANYIHPIGTNADANGNKLKDAGITGLEMSNSTIPGAIQLAYALVITDNFGRSCPYEFDIPCLNGCDQPQQIGHSNTIPVWQPNIAYAPGRIVRHGSTNYFNPGPNHAYNVAGQPPPSSSNQFLPCGTAI